MPPPHGDDRDETQSLLVPQIPSQLAVYDASWQDHPDYVSTNYNIPQTELAPQSSKKPPRPLNAYMLFLADFRKSNADSSEKPTTIEGGKAWQVLPPERKEYYRKLALEVKREHALRYPEYTLQPKKGSERRPYGSRKRLARQSRKSGRSTPEAPSPAIGVFETAEFTFDSSNLQPNYPSQPSQERQMQSTTAFNSPYHNTFCIGPSHTPEQYDSALGLSHVPHPHSRPSLLVTDTSFSSSTTSLDSPSLPIRVTGHFDSSPSTSSNSSLPYYSTETPPSPQNLSLTPYTHSPSINQLAYESPNPYLSPHLYFQQLTLNDDYPTYPLTSGLPLAPVFRPITLPQTQVTDQGSPFFPEASDLSQEHSPVVTFTSPSNSAAVSYHNNLAADWSPDTQNNSHF